MLRRNATNSVFKLYVMLETAFKESMLKDKKINEDP